MRHWASTVSKLAPQVGDDIPEVSGIGVAIVDQADSVGDPAEPLQDRSGDVMARAHDGNFAHHIVSDQLAHFAPAALF